MPTDADPAYTSPERGPLTHKSVGLPTHQGKMSPANAECARASMPKNQNEGVGGDLGRFTKAQRLIGGDGYWVDAGQP
ncbi:hypothetical protein GCM10010234_18080 [Streptomyces hawaiiensis]